MAFAKLTQSKKIPNEPIDRRCPACRQLGLKLLIDPDVGEYVYCLTCRFFATAASIDFNPPEIEDVPDEWTECPKCHRLIETTCWNC